VKNGKNAWCLRHFLLTAKARALQSFANVFRWPFQSLPEEERPHILCEECIIVGFVKPYQVCQTAKPDIAGDVLRYADWDTLKTKTLLSRGRNDLNCR